MLCAGGFFCVFVVHEPHRHSEQRTGCFPHITEVKRGRDEESSSIQVLTTCLMVPTAEQLKDS